MLACAAIGAFGFQKYYSSACPGTSSQANQLSEQDKQELSKLRLLKSDLVNLVMLFGGVKEISGNVITLVSGQNSISFTAAPEAKVYSVSTSGTALGKQTAADFSDIKVGESIQVGAQLSADDELTGYSILIVK
jgi:hypothetical protein